MIAAASGAPSVNGTLPAEYRAAHAGAVVVDRTDVEPLLVRGKDGLDLLHRLSTNALKQLQPGSGAATVFTTNKGRILDLVSVHRVADGLLLLCGASRARTVREWIERYTFREEVTVEDLPAGFRTLGLHGVRAVELATQLLGAEAAGRELHAVMPVTGAGFVVRSFPLGGGSFLIVAPGELIDRLRIEALAASGIEVAAAGRECLELLRIEAGLPAAGHELGEEYNPWEARLQDAIALDKGCYVGQEVIARLEGRGGNVNKALRGLRLSAPAAAGTALTAEGKDVGWLTTAAVSPRLGPIALGYVHRTHFAPGSAVDAAGARATVVASFENGA
jgi:tRNA-modifying protein YgfZ